MVVGTDIAELLMKDRKQTSRRGSIASNTSSLPEGTAAETANLLVSDTHSSSTSILKEEVVTNKFREYLIYGSGKEALGNIFDLIKESQIKLILQNGL